MQFNNLILFDEANIHQQLLPFTYTRPIAEIRIGILTIKEKWENWLDTTASFITETYLKEKYPLKTGGNNLIINASLIPENAVVEQIKQLNKGESLIQNGRLIVAIIDDEDANNFDINTIIEKTANINLTEELYTINHVWDIYTTNDKALKLDFDRLCNNRESASVNSTNILINASNIFIEEGAKINGAILNATDGPIYIGRNTEIMEGSLVRGGFALCDNSTLKMGAKIYGPTSIGPHSKVGGEVTNSVIFGYTNKAHDGFLGNSVIGEWCNLGADSNNSNLKNNYSNIKLWNYAEESFTDTNQQFCGLIMGDHSKCGINTMFNTGTTVGVSANIFGSGFPRNFIPSFSWGGASGFTLYKLEKAFETAELVMSRRNKDFNDIEKNILKHVFEISEKFRL